MVYTQIERIKRDINSISNKIHRLEKQGKNQRAYDLSCIRTIMQDCLIQISDSAK